MSLLDSECPQCGARVANVRRHLKFHRDEMAYQRELLRQTGSLLGAIRMLAEHSVLTTKR